MSASAQAIVDSDDVSQRKRNTSPKQENKAVMSQEQEDQNQYELPKQFSKQIKPLPVRGTVQDQSIVSNLSSSNDNVPATNMARGGEYVTRSHSRQQHNHQDLDKLLKEADQLTSSMTGLSIGQWQVPAPRPLPPPVEQKIRDPTMRDPMEIGLNAIHDPSHLYASVNPGYAYSYRQPHVQAPHQQYPQYAQVHPQQYQVHPQQYHPSYAQAPHAHLYPGYHQYVPQQVPHVQQQAYLPPFAQAAPPSRPQQVPHVQQHQAAPLSRSPSPTSSTTSSRVSVASSRAQAKKKPPTKVTKEIQKAKEVREYKRDLKSGAELLFRIDQLDIVDKKVTTSSLANKLADTLKKMRKNPMDILLKDKYDKLTQAQSYLESFTNIANKYPDKKFRHSAREHVRKYLEPRQQEEEQDDAEEEQDEADEAVDVDGDVR